MLQPLLGRFRSSVAAVTGYGLLLAAWVATNPPGSAPDEPAHHVKAVATAGGQLTGAPVYDLEGHPPIRRPFLADVLQTFDVPDQLVADPRWACNAFTPESAACVTSPLPEASSAVRATVPQQSILGPYPPGPYFPAGVAARVAGRSSRAIYAERTVLALLCLALLGITFHAARSRWTRLAVVLAITPTVVFMSSAVTTSGVEITAALGHTTATLGLVDRPSGERPWAAWAFTGAVLVLARPLGVLWLGLSVLLLLGMIGPSGFRERLGDERRAALPAVVLLTLVTAFAVGWALLVMPHNRATLSEAGRHLGPALRSFSSLTSEAVGVFGWLDVRLPQAAVAPVAGGWVLLIGVASAIGTTRDRILLAMSGLALFVIVMLLQIFTQMPFGFGAQGRYILPMVVGILVFAGRTVDARSAERGASGRTWLSLEPLAVAAITGLHALAWYFNARRAAVGLDGGWWFLTRPEWSPPAGWWPWMGTVAIGCALLFRGGRYRDARLVDA